MRILTSILFALSLALCACANGPVAVKARGQVEMGFGYQNIMDGK